MAPKYEIRVRGHFSPRWRGVFAPLEIAAVDDGCTILRGEVADQSGLHGLLRRIEQHGVPLISLQCLSHDSWPS